jgi:hypothetical protein
MKKLLGLAVLLVVLYFAGTALMKEFSGTPAPEGSEQFSKPGMGEKARTAGEADRKKKEDKLNSIGAD